MALAATVVVATACTDTAFGGPRTATLAELRAAQAAMSRNAITATFGRRSYAPGTWARLTVRAKARRLTVQLFACGPGRSRSNFYGDPVTEPVTTAWGLSGAKRTIAIKVQRSKSGMYFARLVAPDGRTGYAPFVLRPSVIGSARVAIFLPTNTWQAYNLRDMQGDGVGDTWYADRSVTTVDLTRPYLGRGMPPHFRKYDLGFLRWFARPIHAPYGGSRVQKRADFYSDDDFTRFTTGGSLYSRYDLIVFPGHEEYVTDHAYDLITAYRNRGGNLAFLSANNFYYKVIRNGTVIHGRWRWRDLGRPEAALVGVQYVDWYRNVYDMDPYVVRGARVAPWLFEATGLANGERFGNFGIEIDARARSSPRGAVLLARAPNIFGPGKSAEMTYYATVRRAKVFAAGALNFGGSASSPVVGALLDNMWQRLSRP